MRNVIGALTGRLTPEVRRNIITVVGVIGLAIIFMSNFISNDNTPEQAEPPIETESGGDYKEALETQLEDMLSSIEGVGNVKVMVTLDAMGEEVFAIDRSESTNAETTDGSTNRTQQSEENRYVIIRNKDGSEQAVLKKTRLPEVRGVLVVCDGGDSAVVCERVTSAAAGALGISISKVRVAPGGGYAPAGSSVRLYR
ncbi:MAG: hypothetical protein IIY78_02445 [Clostridia bacterium]|nr:hypothetical protein [Clostridia bacterium]